MSMLAYNWEQHGCVKIMHTSAYRGDVSESEGELDGPQNEVVLPQMIAGRGNMLAQKSAIR